uniref:Integrin subunit alpha 6 n=1 Tax=Scleropages formosus TaxID=113540 RepID=A0A8C9VB45_SCLFO
MFNDMTLPWKAIFTGILCLTQFTRISAFNLDAHNVLRKDGEAGTLFGFSVALHRQLKPADRRMLLIGAPRAKALSNQGANITGGLYSCEITALSNDCKRIVFDNEVDMKSEYKEDQWMGVTVDSQGPGGKIVTCAHRYQRRLFVNTPQESRDITGRCYVLSEDLSIDALSDEDGGNWKFCEGRARGHERFGSCQQGLSATFTKDYHYVVFGAPGAYNWKGIANNTLLDQGIYDDGPYEVGDESQLNPDLVPVPANSYLGVLFMTTLSDASPDQFVYKSYPLQVNLEKALDVVANSYLGFSLDTGYNITKKGQLTVVSGAPRANHSGAVVLFKKEVTVSNMLSAEYILEGPGLASSFGYDVAVVDLNKDGWQDIVVGAPQFFLKDGEIGGAVYVYINQMGKWDQVNPIQLNGSKDSMFGLAVENIGDINQDSFSDIAVGAPYDEGGAGRVYIYHGSVSGILTKPAQVILKGVDLNIKLFGYSLSGNMDLDRNSYPDLAVGSLSDAVFVSRPVISIKKDVKIIPKQIDLTKKTCGNNICLTVEACFTYTENSKSYSPKLTIAYLLEAESERRKLGMPSRVTFLTKSRTDQDFQSSGTLELQRPNKKLCTTAQLRLQDNIKDKLRSIPVELSVSIQGTRRKKRQSSLPDLVPILNSNQPNKVGTEVNFLKEGCGIDNICQSNLEVEYKFCYREPNQDVFPALPSENGMPVISLSDQKDIALEVTVKNMNGDDAHEARLVAQFPSSLSFSAFRFLKTGVSLDKHVICVANQNGSQADCDLGNPFKRNSETTFYIILSTAGISLNTTEVDIGLQLETTSEQENLSLVKAKAKVVIELLLSVTGVAKPSQVFFGGDVKGESAMKSEEEIGSLINYEFRIINLGKPLKSFGTASLNIQWPKENAVGKWLLYLVRISTSGLEEIPCYPERNGLCSSSMSRRKREAEEEKESSWSFEMIVFFFFFFLFLQSCNNGARCVEIKCPLQGLDSNAVIVLRSRLWNSTFLEFSYLGRRGGAVGWTGSCSPVGLGFKSHLGCLVMDWRPVLGVSPPGLTPCVAG